MRPAVFHGQPYAGWYYSPILILLVPSVWKPLMIKSVSVPISAMALLAVVGLSGCATMSAEECVSADWYQVGVSDGAEGRSTQRIEQHRQACAEAGVSPNVQAWLAGREEGLRMYCTPGKAFQVGRSGAALAPDCKPEELNQMMPAYRHGERYWLIGQEIQEVESDLRTLRSEIRDVPADATALRLRLEREQGRLEERVRRLRGEQRRYASWP